MRPVTKDDIVPEAILTVKEGFTLTVNPHRKLFGESFEMLDGGVCHVVSEPRYDAGGNCLVRVKINSEEEHEIFYSDALWCCELSSWSQGENDE